MDFGLENEAKLAPRWGWKEPVEDKKWAVSLERSISSKVAAFKRALKVLGLMDRRKATN